MSFFLVFLKTQSLFKAFSSDLCLVTMQAFKISINFISRRAHIQKSFQIDYVIQANIT